MLWVTKVMQQRGCCDQCVALAALVGSMQLANRCATAVSTASVR
jgi:hypothetical protein